MNDDDWKCLPPCPVSKFALAKFGETFVVVGGKLSGTNQVTGKVHRFNSQSETGWELACNNTQMPKPRYDLTGHGHGETLIACCGRDARDLCCDDVQIYYNQQWKLVARFPNTFPNMSATIIHDKCYFLGGVGQAECVCYASLPELLQTSCDSTTTPWKSNFPHTKASNATAVNVHDSLVAIGGKAKISVYSPSIHDWIIPDLANVEFETCHRPAVAELPNGKLLIIGGTTDNNTAIRKVYLFSHVC